MFIINTILDLIFPSKCLFCGQAGSDICPRCLDSAREAERECPAWIFPLYDYRDPRIKKAIWFLKYKNKRRLAENFARVLGPRILEELSDLKILENFEKPLLIPIPLARRRKFERGYNQSTLICKNLIKIFPNNFLLLKNILIKPKETLHQAKIQNRKERLENIIGSFSISYPEKVKGKNIILIDDVTTTGATLSEAKKILREAGARKVIAFTLAH